MKTTSILLAAGLLVRPVLSKPVFSRSPYGVKDSHFVPAKWSDLGAAPADHTIELRIALKQHQFQELERHLYEVSDPSHKRYGQHLTEHDVKKLIQPADNTLSLVHEWLADNGIETDELEYSPAKDWIKVSLPVNHIENLLDTKYSVYRHEDGSEIVRTPEWSLPLHLHEHIDTIQPTNSFFRASPKAVSLQFDQPPQAGGNTATWNAQYYSAPNVSAVCNSSSVTPTCLRTLYGTLDYEPQVAGRNKMGLTDYLGETNNRSDTYLFLEQFRPEAKDAAYQFKFDVIKNGSTEQVSTAAELAAKTDVEGNLDVETMLGIGWPTPLIAYTVGGSPPFKADNNTPTDTNEPYLDWLSYVLSTSDSDLAKVISTSYDDDEQTVPLSYAYRACAEMAQLGARGVSLFFASGDNGVGSSGSCVSNNGTNAPTFLPEFPSSCPYITSVGATMDFNPEVVAYHSTGYAGGGGFSDYFARPHYQDSVVPAYVKSLNGQFAPYYNASGRAYPDLAGQGSYFITVWNGTNKRVSGTSASTPLVSAIFALVNDALVASGRPTMGFLNPWLYKVGHTAFTDITNGSAIGCSEISTGKGFPAQQGWDAVTGFGTPVFPKILELLGVKGKWGQHGGWSGCWA
ncbi:hypothetical protein MBLNU459_g2275t1 [Dothideomycetes sp. NU459]